MILNNAHMNQNLLVLASRVASSRSVLSPAAYQPRALYRIKYKESNNS